MKLPLGLAILVSTAAIIAAHFQAGVAVAHTTLERVDFSSQSDINVTPSLKYWISQDSENIDYLERGKKEYDAKNYQYAIRNFDQYINLHPGDPTGYYRRGQARQGLEDYKGARADFDEAIRLKPDFALAYLFRSIVRIRMNDKEGAIADAQKTLKLSQAQEDKVVYQAAARALKMYQELNVTFPTN
jgi:tetratricopeptide (TPR) repeat protein